MTKPFQLQTGMLAVAAVLALGCSDGGGQGETTTGAQKAAPADTEKLVAECAGCHKPDKHDLSTQSRDALRKTLEAIRSGDKKHPTDLGKLSDAELDGLAAALTEAP